MDRSKQIIFLLVVIIVLLLFMVALLCFKTVYRSNGAENSNETFGDPASLSANSTGGSGPNDGADSITIKNKEEQPSLITGTVDSIDKEKIVIKQFARTGLKYEIKKGDIDQIITLKPNSEFDEEKANKVLENTRAEIENSKTKPNAKPKEETKKLLEDPALKRIIEETVAWEKIESGAQAGVQLNGKGQRVLIIYPRDSDMSPPKLPEE